MNTMLSSATELEIRIRRYIRAKMQSEFPGALYTFDMAEGIDCSTQDAGPIFDQDQPFFLFESNITAGGRAGPGWVSPRRYRGTLDIAFFVKLPRDKVQFTGIVERIADWFQDQTIDGIRFRTFVPTPAVQLRGFTSYNGVINFEFEISLTR